MTGDHLLQDRAAVAVLVRRIADAAARLGRPATLMEVCGTHTHAVAAAGLRRMLPEGIRLVSGPGCPVCVTPVGYLDRALALAARPGTVLCTFGDLMRVPSSTVSLEQARAAGRDIRIVYSPRDALAIAQETGLQLVFLAVGFETTTPTIAAALAEAEATATPNFQILPGNKLIPPAIAALVSDPDLEVHGFLLPGHVSVLTGWRAFEFLADEHGVPGAVVGFAPTDILRGVLELVEQNGGGRSEIVNLYSTVVSPSGNRTAAALVERFFAPADDSWRGFGVIPRSGLALRPEWAHRDASRIPVELPPPQEPAGCRCGEVLRGVIDPPACPLFDEGCTPSTPVGACMVSSEGTCSAWFRNDRWGAT
ncbi:MAG TPA: hydrogenase formation protein HypD [Thermoanaerobaculales bacterium]|nr:hydrogenase formation protein HypD [Thermoanaerobaculales bacterium]